MTSRRAFLGRALALAAVGVSAAACGSATRRSPASAPAGATAITEVFGDGQKLTAVAVEYPEEIATSRLTTAAFTVANRTVTKVYTNASPATAPDGVDGRYVIVELSTDDAGAGLWQTSEPGGTPAAGSSGTGAGQGGPSATGQGGPPAGGQGGPPKAGQAGPAPKMKAATATVTQARPVAATGGTTYPANPAAMTTSSVSNLIVDDFRQLAFSDPATGQSLNYNLFTPRNYDPARSYPLVLFMHDASVVGGEPRAALVQGLGAVCWASPGDQATRESFVLAPAYPTVVIDDDYRPTVLFDTTVSLVKALTRQYSIDPNRLDATGQSMGAMMTLGLNIRYPELFAASYVVAGQWPSAEVAPLAEAKLWIVVSQGDDKAYPGENAITDVIARNGVRVSRATWDGRSTPEAFAADVARMRAQDSPSNYAAFVKGSVLPPGSTQTSEPCRRSLKTRPLALFEDRPPSDDWVGDQLGDLGGDSVSAQE